MFDRDRFWKLIEQSKSSSKNDLEEQYALLLDELAGMSEEDILSFDQHFCELRAEAYRWDLWAAASLLGGGCSDDGFIDFRAWLIGRGRKVYAQALQDPDSLADVVRFEDGILTQDGELQYVASDAWQQLTGQSEFDYPAKTLTDPSEPSGVRWTEEEFAAHLPKLARKFLLDE